VVIKNEHTIRPGEVTVVDVSGECGGGKGEEFGEKLGGISNIADGVETDGESLEFGAESKNVEWVLSLLLAVTTNKHHGIDGNWGLETNSQVTTSKVVCLCLFYPLV
jgi:hypothetical protein